MAIFMQASAEVSLIWPTVTGQIASICKYLINLFDGAFTLENIFTHTAARNMVRGKLAKTGGTYDHPRRAKGVAICTMRVM